MQWEFTEAVKSDLPCEEVTACWVESVGGGKERNEAIALVFGETGVLD